MVEIASLTAPDRAEWNHLVRQYMAFYQTVRTDAEYDALWRRLIENREIHAAGARIDGALVGFAHYLYHASGWSADVCYLQDLFVDPQHRGRGIGRALIEFVARQAQLKQAPRLYWLTQSSNESARALYDKVAAHTGFIGYEKPLI
ncbi:GNAT family N-acetyltransferase [Methylomonas koyamae]|uniref:GNAT family N-acetyltransferase n=1 Tax=Methylomonas koyamae TaxID=702114 RepID=UPI001127F1B8|nr:GNAT family N-acetyltransferase [Methylomonas koyamae]TPQ25984.1 GNAT family N-acetyltransferase [Methylomonas koyamae]